MKTYIVAEIGVNHNGSPEVARLLIDKAIECGADAIKLQLWKELRWPSLRHLWLHPDHILELMDYASVDAFCTPFDIESVNILTGNQHVWKIPSHVEVWSDDALLKAIADIKKDTLIVSTGNWSLAKSNKTLDYFHKDSARLKYLLHCKSEYPTRLINVEIDKMMNLERGWDHLGFMVGLSDHSGNPNIAAYATCLGAKMVEAHITLDKNLEGPDHKASLDINEFKQMVTMVREVELVTGGGTWII